LHRKSEDRLPTGAGNGGRAHRRVRRVVCRSAGGSGVRARGCQPGALRRAEQRQPRRQRPGQHAVVHASAGGGAVQRGGDGVGHGWGGAADVAFSYGRELLLEDVSFHAEPGEMIGLVGHTGAGKTTIASLLCRFYDPIDGAIMLDGYDLRDLSFKTLRESVGLVLQDNFLFSGTIADNIRYARPGASDE